MEYVDAYIKLTVPEFQLGSIANVYFYDTMVASHCVVKPYYKDEIIQAMANEMVQLRIDYIQRDTENGCCPVAMYPLKDNKLECTDGMSCGQCKSKYYKLKRKEYLEEILKDFDVNKGDDIPERDNDFWHQH